MQWSLQSPRDRSHFPTDRSLPADRLRSVRRWECPLFLMLLNNTRTWNTNSKYHSFAIHASSGKTYDPCLTLQGQFIPSIGNNAIRSLLQVPREPHHAKQHLQSKLTSLLDKVDAVPVKRNRAAICPGILFSILENCNRNNKCRMSPCDSLAC